jgi:hypothetical protein
MKKKLLTLILASLLLVGCGKKENLQPKIAVKNVNEKPYYEYNLNVEGSYDIFKYKISKVRISEVETEDVITAVNDLKYDNKQLEKINDGTSLYKIKPVKKTIAIVDFELESISNESRIFELVPKSAKFNNNIESEWLSSLGVHPEGIYKQVTKRQGYFVLDLGNTKPKKVKNLEITFSPPLDGYAKPKGHDFKINLKLK